MVDWSSPAEITTDYSTSPAPPTSAPGLSISEQSHSPSSCTSSTGSTCKRPSDGSQSYPNLCPFCSWEFALSADFDWQFISGKKKFRWPLVRETGTPSRLSSLLITRQVFYFAGRYILLLALTGMYVQAHHRRILF